VELAQGAAGSARISPRATQVDSEITGRQLPGEEQATGLPDRLIIRREAKVSKEIKSPVGGQVLGAVQLPIRDPSAAGSLPGQHRLGSGAVPRFNPGRRQIAVVA
jgi:hypothetical protein